MLDQSVGLLGSFPTPKFSYQAIALPYLFNKKSVGNIALIPKVGDKE